MSDRNKSSKDAAKDRAESSNKGMRKILQELEEWEELEETIIPFGGRSALRRSSRPNFGHAPVRLAPGRETVTKNTDGARKAPSPKGKSKSEPDGTTLRLTTQRVSTPPPFKG